MSADPVGEAFGVKASELIIREVGLPSPELRRAVVMLVAGNLNHHLLNCNGDDDPATEWKPWLGCDGCCPECCAPCKAMTWLRDHANDALTEWLNDWDPHPNGRWDWQLPGGSVNWEMVERHWKPDQLQCHDEGDDMGDPITDEMRTPLTEAELAEVNAHYAKGCDCLSSSPPPRPGDATVPPELADVQAVFNRLPIISEKKVTVTLVGDDFTEEQLAEIQAAFDASPFAAKIAEFLADPSMGVRRERPKRRTLTAFVAEEGEEEPRSTVPEGYSFHD